MAKEKFESRTLKGIINVACKLDDGTVRYWNDEKENIVKQIISIVTEYRKQGYVLTLRQLHYQFVSKDMKYVNHQTAYKKLGSILDDCRYSGLIDWAAIEDRGRTPYIPYEVDDLEDALQDTIDLYRLNRQKGQTNNVEVWSEKDALSGIFKRTTIKYHVKLVVNKGYTSSSAAYAAYQRFCEKILDDKKVLILYLGDHDPSGLDMIRDIKERLMFFFSRGDILSRDEDFVEKVSNWWDENEHTYYEMNSEGYLSDKWLSILEKREEDDLYEKAIYEFDYGKIQWYLEENDFFRVEPIALTKWQIDLYNLPPNPTKLSDTRSMAYINEFGKTCWELDALDAPVLTQLIETNIKQNIDIDLFDQVCEEEEDQIEALKKFIEKGQEDNE
jgi:hypothetical protein